MKRKRGQIQAQVFVYVLAMLVISLVLLYGYRSINTMGERAKQVDLLVFKNDVIKSVEKVSNDFGTVRAPTFNIPPDYEEVCFIDLYNSPEPEIESEHPLVYEAWEDASANVFLITDLVAESFLVAESDGGAFIDSIDCYFYSKDDESTPVRLEIRPMENGYPTPTPIPTASINATAMRTIFFISFF